MHSLTRRIMSGEQLIHLILEEKWDEARSMIRKADNPDLLINARYGCGDNALFIAIWMQAPKNLIRCIIDASENAVFATNKDGEQPLHYATYYGASYEVLLTLIQENPAALDHPNAIGSTPRDYLSENMLDERSKELVRKETASILEDMIEGRCGHSSRVMARSIVKMSQRVRVLEEKATEAEIEAALSKVKLESSAETKQDFFGRTFHPCGIHSR